MITPTRVKVTVEELANQIRNEMIPLGSDFSYFLLMPVAEEDLKQYLEDPVAALPPILRAHLPKTGIVLAPYLERAANGKSKDLVDYERPPEQRQIFASRLLEPGGATLFFAIKDEEMADYHYSFYNALAAMAVEIPDSPVLEQFAGMVREELAAEVHGEVDERSWHLKQNLLRRQGNLRKETKLFHEYVQQALEDTLTLYLHGICCDIDVETGPRQMPSRHLRKRLELLAKLYPPPKGYAVLPEHPKRR